MRTSALAKCSLHTMKATGTRALLAAQPLPQQNHFIVVAKISRSQITYTHNHRSFPCFPPAVRGLPLLLLFRRTVVEPSTMRIYPHRLKFFPSPWHIHHIREEALRKFDIDLLRDLCLNNGVAFPETTMPTMVLQLLSDVAGSGIMSSPFCERGEDCATAVLLSICFADTHIAQPLFRLRSNFIRRINGVVVLELKCISALMLAAWRRSVPATTLLLRFIKKGLNHFAHPFDLVRARDEEGRTALHFAAEGGHFPLIWPLLMAGSNPMQVNMKGQTALDVCGGGLTAQLLRTAVKEIERIKLLKKARAASDEAHRVASSLLLAHCLRKAKQVENVDEKRKEEKRLSRRMTAFILHEKTTYVKVHGQERGMLRQPRRQNTVEGTEKGGVEERVGMHMEGLSRRMAAFVLNEKTPSVKVHGEKGGTPLRYQEKGEEQGKEGKGEEEEKEAEADKQRAVLAYVVGERMPGNEGRVLIDELFVELVRLMTPPWAAI